MAYPDARHYQTQQIMNATAAQQVVMMYDGAIRFCLRAKEAIEKGEIQERHNANKRAMEVVNYLMDILDLEKGGEVARRLQIVYAFLLRRMLEVDFRNDPRICDEVVEHLRTLRSSWDQIVNTAEGSGTPGQIDEVPRVRSAVA